jgi:predicted MFS family arabinose efflux permease
MTPQVLSIIQAEFADDALARAIGAYSLILAVGVAAGQVVGGALVGAGLLDDAWRPALLVNAPVGMVLLLAARRGLPAGARQPGRRLDLAGAALLAVALLALVLPLTLGRDAGRPAWVWPCLALAAVTFAGFSRLERARRDPVLDLAVLAAPGVAAGVLAVAVLMGCYAGFLFAVTLHLQEDLGFSPLRSGLTFAAYAAGFAVASLGCSRLSPPARERLPVTGPLLMAAALAAIGAVGVALPLLFTAGVGHACGFSPLTAKLTATVAPRHRADLSGLVLTASLVGSVLGTATLGGLSLTATTTAAAVALTATTAALATRSRQPVAA